MKTLFGIGVRMDDTKKVFFKFNWKPFLRRDGRGWFAAIGDTLIVLKDLSPKELWQRPIFVQLTVGLLGKYRRRIFIVPADYAVAIAKVGNQGIGKYFLHFSLNNGKELYINFIFKTKNYENGKNENKS